MDRRRGRGRGGQRRGQGQDRFKEGVGTEEFSMLYHSVTYPYAHNHAQTSEDIAIAHIYQKRRGEMWLKEETANYSFHRKSRMKCGW